MQFVLMSQSMKDEALINSLLLFFISCREKCYGQNTSLDLSVCFILTYTVLAIFIIHSFDLFWYFEVQKSGFSVKSSVFSIVSYVMME